MDEYDYPVGGPCGWMWARKKEKILAQDYNPEEKRIPAGQSGGGEWTQSGSNIVASSSSVTSLKRDAENAAGNVKFAAPTKEDGRNNQSIKAEHFSNQQKEDKSYLRDAIYPAPDLFDLPVLPIGEWKSLKEAYGFSKETLLWLADYFSREASQKALAGASGRTLKKGENFSGIFERKGKPSSPKKHVNKYADKSKAEAQAGERVANAQRKRTPERLQALENIRLRSSLEEHENAGGHMIKEHGLRTNEGLGERFNEPDAPETSSCFESNKLMQESAEKAVKDNAEEIYDWLHDPNRVDDLPINVKMSKNIGRSMRASDRKVTDKRGAKFLLQKNAKMAEGFNFLTGFPE